MESLVGVVLMSIIGLGVTYATSRVLVSQRDMNMQNLAVIQMRSLLQQYGSTLCGTNAAKAVLQMPTKTIALTASCTDAPIVKIQGKDVELNTSQKAALKRVVLSTPNQGDDLALFGGVIKVGDQI